MLQNAITPLGGWIQNFPTGELVGKRKKPTEASFSDIKMDKNIRRVNIYEKWIVYNWDEFYFMIVGLWG